ncbi:MAG: MFS transporter [Promicromonosporaceae bacterium]|nr:MFS transporter [Promicromonosporaceae bacterium]
MGVIRELRQLLRLQGFRRLFAVRLLSQAGDGAFQVGLATVLFFSPENAGTAREVAAGFAVMFAPFVIAPFVGVLLDRWRRRQVLLWANVVRCVVTAGAALAMFTAGGTWVVAAIGLVALSVNRFILSGLSAGLPNVLDRELLLTANSIVPTLGAGATFVGGGVGLVLGLMIPPGSVRDGASLVVASVLMLVAALAALRLRPDQLGPVHPRRTPIRDDVAVVLRDLGQGARYLTARVTPGQGLLAMAAHRLLYGIVFIASILIARNLLSPGDLSAGIATFAVVVGLTGVGGALAVVITPTISRYTGPQVWVGLMLLFAAVSQVMLSVTYARWMVYLCAALLGMAAQAAKIAVDTIVATDTHDEFRGRAFAFYDLLFNAAFTGAAVLAAFVVPDQGWSRGLFLVLAGAYVVVAVVVLTRFAREPREVDLALYVTDESGPAGASTRAEGIPQPDQA